MGGSVNEKVTVTTSPTSFLNAINDSGKMRHCRGSLSHNDEYLTRKKFALTDVFGTERNNGLRISERLWEWVSYTGSTDAVVSCNNMV